jgi:L-ascorbate metabolism protein UlaG (beta-lactamase superfamily)
VLTWLIIIAAIVLIAYLFMNVYPAFGGKASKGQLQLIQQSPNFSKGKFSYPIPTNMSMSFKTTMTTLVDFVKGNPKGKPAKPIAIEALSLRSPQGMKQGTITWFGHSALLLEMNGKVLFLDPMLGRAPSPFPQMGGGRYSKSLPIEIEDLPTIDAIILSHDHYDHLDYGSIRKLKGKVKQFFVPLGVGAHLVKWGVEPERIREFDWWEELEWEGFTLASTPARHFSGRGLMNRNSTLWCSWVIADPNTRIFFSGDSGYGPHFEQIGQKYGPFDWTFMECGQYDVRWSDIHLLPEETVQAHLDVRGGKMIPIHWGAFTLALHDWTDPVERVLKAAGDQGVTVVTPKIGETVSMKAAAYPSSTWWR